MSHLSLLVIATVLIAGLILFLLRLRWRFGLAPLYVTLGGFLYLQIVLSRWVSIEILPGRAVDLGPAVLPVATLFAVLMLYIREDAPRVRQLIVGLVVASVSLDLVTRLLGLHLGRPGSTTLLDLPREILIRDPMTMIVTTALLLIDSVLIIVAYEAVSRYLPRLLLLRMLTGAAVVLLVDSAIYAATLDPGRADFASRAAQLFLARMLVATVLAVIFAAHFRFFRRAELETELVVAERRDVLEVLTTEERFDRMRALVVRDPLTGLFNRGFFDETLPLELARSERSRLPTSLLLLDLDHFKRINDDFGHPEGDRVLRELAAALSHAVREADAPCRIGGEEFAVVLPHAAAAAAMQTAERIRARFAERVANAAPPLAGGRVTMTVGAASYPAEAGSASELVRLADERLYEGKRQGRDRVVGGKV